MAIDAGSPVDIYKSVLQTKYADFSGRARRAEYWWFTLVNLGVTVGIFIVAAILGAIAKPLGVIGMLAYLAYALGTFIPGIAASVRRLHDTGKSGWFLLISFVPIVGSIALLVFLFTDSTTGTNTYGVSPKYGA